MVAYSLDEYKAGICFDKEGWFNSIKAQIELITLY